MNYTQQKAYANKVCGKNARYRGPCPACGGENTFTVSRLANGLVWTCFRSSCDLKGGDSTFSVASLAQAIEKQKAPEDTPLLTHNNSKGGVTGLDLPPFPVPQMWRGVLSASAREILDKYKIMHHHTNRDVVLYDDCISERLYFMVQVRGTAYKTAIKVVGAVGRYYGNDIKVPKWRVQGETKGQPFHMPVHITNDSFLTPEEIKKRKTTCIIVEDAISACKVSFMGDGMALLGTNLTDQTVSYMIDHNYDRVLVFLDSDAMNKASAICSKLSGLFASTIISIPSGDPKDCDYKSLASLLA